MVVARRRTATKRVVGARPTAITSIADTVGFKNWMVFGETGAGKTVLGGTAPKALFLTFEPEGTESAKVFGSTGEALPIHRRQELLDVYDYFDVGTGCDDYEWVIMDSTSEMEECFWRDHLRTQKEKKPTTRSLYKAALDDYPQVWNQVKHEIDRWNRLPINVLYTAQVLPIERYDDDEDEEYTELLPLMGSTKNAILSRKVCGMVSLVGFLEPKRKKVDGEVEEWRRLYVSRRKEIMAKNRYGWGSYIDNPTIPALVAAADTSLSGKSTTTNRRTRRTRATA